MAKIGKQKPKILFLAKIFFEETDEDHGLTIKEIIQKLDAYGIRAERKALAQDFDTLADFGMEIKQNKDGNTFTYHLISRNFELPELKLLVDSVQSSKFISEKKSNELIKKLEGLTSKHQASQLHRQVLLVGRVKSMNESTYYTVDEIHNAINANRQIKFRYVNWNINKEEQLRRDGKWYQVSPIHLRWDDEYYYLIAFNTEFNEIRHYRVDKMKNITITDLPPDGEEQIKAFNPAEYAKKLFGMFSGEIRHVTIRGENSKIGILIDRFGRDIPVLKVDDNHFDAVVEAAISPQFYGWIASLGDGIEITAPQDIKEGMREFANKLADRYNQ